MGVLDVTGGDAVVHPTRRAAFALPAAFFINRLPLVAKEKAYFPPPDAKGGWRTLKDAPSIAKHAGLDTTKLDAAFEACKETSQHGGLLVARHGYLVYERYFGRGAREATPELASCGKAYTSISVGVLMGQKRDRFPDGLSQKVFTGDYMIGEAFPLDDARKADIQLGQLLAMSAGIRGTNPGYVKGEKVVLNPPAQDGPIATTDPVALHQPLWCAPGGGYSYATSSPHLASMVVRQLSGMEMEQYMRVHIGEPCGWGRWGYAMHRPNLKMDHTPGGGSIAVRSTDVLRFAYLLLRQGKWEGREVLPADYVAKCGALSPYNPHYPYSLMFEVNGDNHVAGAPSDAFWKSGAGGFCIYVVPSLDLVIYKMGGNEGQYNPELTGLPVLYSYDGSRDGWKPAPGAGDGSRKVLERVVSAVKI
ncbi:MAG: serine hydrolase domain-containing protein [Acidobacteriota bacterium]